MLTNFTIYDQLRTGVQTKTEYDSSDDELNKHYYFHMLT